MSSVPTGQLFQSSQSSQGSQSRQFLPEPQSAQPKYQSPYADPGFESRESRNETVQQFMRQAGRLNASAASDQEYKELLGKRTDLMKKKLAGQLTKKEEAQLEYVRWSLDRIEDAKHGSELDKLEAQVEEIRRLAMDIMGLRDGLNKAANRRR